MSTGLHSTTSSVQASSILNDLNYAQINLPIITTEEEFKNMENAVNNLLVSKKHIDNLKAERNSLIQIYENKIKEQNEQISILKEENLKLNSTMEKTNWSAKYEPNMENIMRQMLNSLKIQETIRTEYSKIISTQTNTLNCSFICTSNSWTFNRSEETPAATNAHQDLFESSSSFSSAKIKLQELLVQQQKVQLSLYNDLNEIFKSLRNSEDSQNINNSVVLNLNHSQSNLNIGLFSYLI